MGGMGMGGATHPLVDWPALDGGIAWRSGQPITCERFLSDVHTIAASLPQRTYAINICADRYAFLVGFAAALLRGQINLLPPSRVTTAVVAIAQCYPDHYLLSDAH